MRTSRQIRRSLIASGLVFSLSGPLDAQVAPGIGAPPIGPRPGSAGSGSVPPNRRPVADAGADRTVGVGATARLDGSRSSDADGQRLSFHWSLVRRPAASQAVLTDASSVAPSFVVDAPGTYVARLVTSDGLSTSRADVVTIDSSNSAPVADAGPGQTVPVGSVAHLSATASTDVDGDALAYAWTLQSAPNGSAAAIATPRAVAPTFVPDLPGRYVARLVVSDGAARSAPALVTIDTTNSRPESVANAMRSVALGATVSLDASRSTDVDGDRLAYRWALISRPDDSAAALTDADAVATTFIADRPGLYVAQLVTSDGKAESEPASVTIATANSAPIARTTPGRSVPLGQAAVLDGGSSSDPDGDPLSYRWALVSRPAGSAATLVDAHTAMPMLVLDRPGTYVAQLIVNDGIADSPPVTTTLHNPLAPPVAVAAIGSQVGTTVNLDGSGSFDPDLDPLTYAWSLIATPGGSSASLSDPSAVNPSFVVDLPGAYVAQLIVNDGTANSAPATASLIFSQLRANAGPDQVLSAVGVVAQLAGSGTLNVTSWAWSFVSKPAGSAAALSDPTIAAPAFAADVAGDYILQLVVGDGTFQSAPDSVVISTNPPSLVLSPNRLSLVPSGSGTLTLTIPAPLGVGGLNPTIVLTSSDPTVASVPATVVVPAGQFSTTIPVTGGVAGGAIITASGGAWGSGRAVVGVGANVVEWIVDASGTWETPANWSGGAVPAAGDVVVIDRPAGYFTVTITQPTNAIRTLLATEAVGIASTLTVTGDALFSGGMGLAGNLTVGRAALAGPAEWFDGVANVGQLDVMPGQTLTASTTSNKILAAGVMTNNGTVVWAGGPFYIQGGAAVTNASGALWDVQADVTVTSTNCGAPTFTNAGTLRKSAGPGSLVVASCVAFSNTGTVEVQTGALVNNAGPALVNSGRLVAASGTTIYLGNFTLENGTTFGGTGLLHIFGTTVVNGNVSLTVPTLQEGDVNGTGAITLGAAYTWATGWTRLTGGVTVPTGQTLTIATSWPIGGQKVLETTLVNEGTVVWSADALYLQATAAVTNAAGALWEVQGDLVVTSTNCGTPTFTNAGTLRKSVGTGAFVVSSCVAMTNTGTVDIQTGSLANSAGPAFVNTGQLSAAAGATLALDNFSLESGTTFAGTGLAHFNGVTAVNGNVTLAIPTLHTWQVNGTGAITVGAAYTWEGGWTRLTGGMTVPAGQTVTMSGGFYKVLETTLVNQGTVVWSGGTFYLQAAAAATNASGALWEVRGDLGMTSSNCGTPTFTNAGTLRKSAGTGWFEIGSCVALTNTATLEVLVGALVNSAGPAVVNSGQLVAAAGATLYLNNVTLENGTTFGGTGALEFFGVSTVNGTVTLTLPAVQTGTINGTGKVILGAPFNWIGGWTTLAGGVEVPVGQVLTLSLASDKVLQTALVNHGTAIWSAGTLYLQAAAAVTNAVGSVWDVQGDLTMTSTNCGTPTFTNAGTLRKSAGTGALTLSLCVAVTNTGTVDVQAGSLVNGAGPAFVNSGQLIAAATATLNLHNFTLESGTTFGGTGLLNFNGTTVVNADLTLPLPATQAGNVSGTGKLTLGASYTWSAGWTTLTGGMAVPVGQVLTMSSVNDKVLQNGPLVNNGTVITEGPIYLQGNVAVNNAPGGVWELMGSTGIGSTNCGTPTFTNVGLIRMTGAVTTFGISSCVAFINPGTLQLRLGGNLSHQYDTFVGGTVALGGTLDLPLINGFTPAPGDTLIPVYYTARTGVFGTINTYGQTYLQTYGPTSLTLQKQ